MRVLHINCNYTNNKLHKTMLEHFDSEYKNTVFCPIMYGRKDDSFISPDVYIEECFSQPDRALYFLKQRKIWRRLNDVIIPGEYDLIHAYTLFTDGNIAMKLSKTIGIPYVVAVRGTDINEFFSYRPYLISRGIEIMKNASKVFFLSEQTKLKMLDNYVPEKLKNEISQKSVVIPNGIDDYWLQNIYYNRDIKKVENNLQNKRLNILCVSQIYKDKNISFVQKALHMLEKEGWHIKFSVVGKKVDKKEFLNLTRDKLTTCYPPVNKQKLIRHYRSNDLFIMLSHHETFGLVYAEAMSQGLPVLYTKGQGFDGQFENGCVGYSTSDRDIADVRKKILSVCDRYNDLYIECIKKCEKFSWTAIISLYEEIYREINVKGKCVNE